MKIDWKGAPCGATHVGIYYDGGDMEYYRPTDNEMGGEYYDTELSCWKQLCTPFKEVIKREYVTSMEDVQESI